MVSAILKQTCFLFLFLLTLAAATRAPADDNTLIITLPPPSIQPPAAAAPRAPATYQQARMTMDGGEVLASPSARAPSSPPPPPASVEGRLGFCAGGGAGIYRGAAEGGRLLARVPQGSYLAIKTEYAGWYGVLMIDGTIGWILKRDVRLLDYDVVRPPSSAPPQATSLGNEVLRQAFKYLGVPYVWGGNGSRGLDCSGLVKNCFASCGVWLPRRASEQARVGRPIPLSLAALQPGDRLYFAVSRPTIDHTAIYLGNGYFIDAALSRGKVGIGRLSTPLYGRHLVAARRS